MGQLSSTPGTGMNGETRPRVHEIRGGPGDRRVDDVGTPPVGLHTHAMDADTNDLNVAWNRVQSALPEGWALDGLRCASTGLTEEERSDEWIAAAVGPDGAERRSRAADPVAALEGLVGPDR
jgi:hypothetical protein